MEELRSIEKCLISQVKVQCSDLKQVDARELGEVVDMIKDLEEAMYYCSIIEAMEKGSDWDYHMTEMDKRDISRHIYGDHRDLESYVDNLEEMAEKSSMEEKQVLSAKLQQLATKIK